MTAVTSTVPDAPSATTHVGGSRAVPARRWFIVASPVLAGLFAVVGAYADPAVGLTGRELYELYAANPEPLQFKSLGFHWSYAFWMAPALLLAGYVRGRGAWLANIAALVGFAGMTTLPGLLIVDYYDSAIGQTYGVEGALAVEGVMEGMWGLPVFALPGIVGLVLALPLAMLAMWRARRVRWWAPAAAVAAFAVFTTSGITWWGCAVATGFLTVVAVAVERGTRPDQASPRSR
jgi:hypothetical protein